MIGKPISEDFVDSISGTNGIGGAADAIRVIDRKRNENDGLLKITGRDMREAEYAVKISDHGWSLKRDTLKDAAKAARTESVTAGLW
jgi:hypothetical protein